MHIEDCPTPRLFSSPSEYNEILDNYLRKTNILNKELIVSFDDSYTYQQATSVNWLIAKLNIIKERIDNNEVIKFENDTLLNASMFKEWIKNRYPGIADKFI